MRYMGMWERKLYVQLSSTCNTVDGRNAVEEKCTDWLAHGRLQELRRYNALVAALDRHTPHKTTSTVVARR